MTIDYRSPLAKAQKQSSVQNILTWVNSVTALGTEASSSINVKETAKFIGETLGVPNHLIQNEIFPISDIVEDVSVEE